MDFFRQAWRDILWVFSWVDPVTGRRHLFWWTWLLLAVLALGFGLAAAVPARRLLSAGAGEAGRPASPVTPASVLAARIAGCGEPEPGALYPMADTEDVVQQLIARSGLRKLSPSCLYDSLARETAFLMLRAAGYSAAEAHEILGIDRFYYRPGRTPGRPVLNEFGVNTFELKGVLGLEKDLLVWTQAPDGSPLAVTYAVWGCYSGRAPGLPGEYPVECLVRDLAPEGVGAARLGDAAARDPGPQPASERILVFGYRGGYRWELVGVLADNRPVDDLEKWLSLYRAVVRGQGTELWDTAWLERTFGVRPRPLPPEAAGWPPDFEAVGKAVLKAEGF